MPLITHITKSLFTFTIYRAILIVRDWLVIDSMGVNHEIRELNI